MAENFQSKLFNELRLFLSPIANGVQTPEGRRDLLLRVGWRSENVDQAAIAQLATALNDFAQAYNDDLLPLIDHPPQTLEDLPKALEQAGGVVSALVEIASALQNLPNIPDGLDVIGEDLLGLAAVQYLDQRSPVLRPLFVLLTLLREQRFPAVVSADGQHMVRDPVTVDRFDIGRIVDLIRDPLGILKQEYHLEAGLTQADLTADTLFPRIADLGQAMGLPMFFGFNPLDGIDLGDFGNDRAPHMLMVFVPLAGDVILKSLGFGTGLALNENLGLVVFPFGTLETTLTAGRWLIDLNTGASFPPFAVSKNGVSFPDDTGPAKLTFQVAASLLPARGSTDQTSAPTFQVGSATGTRLEISGFRFVFDGGLTRSSREFGILAEISKAALVLTGKDGDGFLSSILPPNSRVDFSFGIGWSTEKGLYFKGGATLDVTLPLSLSVAGVLEVNGIHLTITAGGDTGGLDVVASTTIAAHIGPVDATADRVGVKTDLTFPDGGGNLGPLNGTLGFKLPDGVGIEVNAGPVSGGGFLFIDAKAGRYAGACELSVYGVAVKAFGVIDTKFPDGSKGFSFVIVISAEFTPIQLGFGFTLLGVGGLVGINRTLDQDALRGAIRSHGLDNILFPHDVIENAPAIIHDLTAIFPASEGHYVFGPLAKLGWGTPTVIDAELGLILVLPGPLLALLGEVHSTLPNQESALVNINIAIAGVLDFPQKKFSLDGSLHDSKVGQYTLSGDMAMRLSWGASSSFALSVGGFNPGFTPPSGFPALARVAVDMGLGGNPAIRHEGYLAVTSNTLQIGARSQITAHGGGIDLDGHLGWDALFVLSPFSFTATFDAGVSVRFHGHGIGVHLHGEISGPSPWRVQGEVCVSILFWDACLGFDKTFGGEPVVELPAIDPFLGSPPTAALVDQDVVGLKNALEDARNWSSLAPPGSFTVVTLAARKEGDEAPPPVDPLGAGVLHQRVVPLNRKITLYAGVKPLGPGQYNVDSVTVSNGIAVSHSFVQDDFAPATFKKMSDAEKLSNRSFEPMDAGVKLVSDEVKVGSIVPHGVSYDTIVVGGPPGSPPSPDPQPGPQFTLTDRHLAGMTARSATALFGMRVAGAERFVDPTAKLKVELRSELFVVAQRGVLAAAANFVSTTTRSASTLALEAAVAATPSLASQLHVVPFHELPVAFPPLP